MKVSLQQITIPNTTTVDVTDASISSDWQGAIIWGGGTTANATTTAGAIFEIGACDAGGHQCGIALNSTDNATGGNAALYPANAACLPSVLAGGGASTLLTYSSTLSNGVRLSSNGASGRLANVLMFAGSDVAFGVGSTHVAGGTTSAVITHNLSVTPDCVIILGTNQGNFGSGGNTTGFSVGFYDGSNSVGFGGSIVSAANPTNVGAICGTTNVGEQISSTPADQGALTISAVGSSSLTVSRNNNTQPGNYMAIAIGHNPALSAVTQLAYTDQTPSVTGNNTPVSTLTIPPMVWLNFSTRLTSTAFANNDNAGSWGFGAAVNNVGAAQTQQGTAGSSFKYNVAPSVAKTYTTINQASVTLSNAGAAGFASTLSSWNTNGITENVGTAGAAAWERINLLIASTPVTPAPILYERRYVTFYT